MRILPEEKRWVACLDCLRGSIYDKSVVPTVSECQVCHDVRPCIDGDRVGLFVPFIPLMMPDYPDQPIDNKNRCSACKDKRVVLSSCMGCHQNKCDHLMKPCSPYCLACLASAS